MKVIQIILGLIGFVLLTVYQWLPFFGVLSIIGGVVGFVTGSEIAGRALLLGIILLSVRYAIALLFQWILNRGSNPKDNTSRLPVEITDDDRRQYELEELEYLRRYADGPAYNFDDEDPAGEDADSATLHKPMK